MFKSSAVVRVEQPRMAAENTDFVLQRIPVALNAQTRPGRRPRGRVTLAGSALVGIDFYKEPAGCNREGLDAGTTHGR